MTVLLPTLKKPQACRWRSIAAMLRASGYNITWSTELVSTGIEELDSAAIYRNYRILNYIYTDILQPDVISSLKSGANNCKGFDNG